MVLDVLRKDFPDIQKWTLEIIMSQSLEDLWNDDSLLYQYSAFRQEHQIYVLSSLTNSLDLNPITALWVIEMKSLYKKQCWCYFLVWSQYE